jgi:hypothetical protein
MGRVVYLIGFDKWELENNIIFLQWIGYLSCWKRNIRLVACRLEYSYWSSGEIISF